MYIFNVNNSSIIIYWTLKNLWDEGIYCARIIRSIQKA